MQRIILSALMFFYFTRVSAGDEKTIAPSFLKSATVYRNGAELFHMAKASLHQGNNDLVIDGISNSIDVNSLQIGSDQNVTIMSAEFATDFLKPAIKSVTVKKLEDSLELAGRELAKIQVILKTDNDLLDLLKANKEIRGAQTGLSVTELMKMMDYYRMKTLELQNEIAVLKEKEKKFSEMMAKIKSQLSEEEQKNTGTVGKLSLQLNCPQAGIYNFNISYITQTAYWNPYYDLRVISINKPISLVYKARIVQSSGLDWKQVKLTLSTSSPNQTGNAPVLSSWFVGYYNPIAQMENSLKSNRFQSLAPAALKKEGRSDLNETVVTGYGAVKDLGDYISVKEKELNITFDIDLPYDVPGNGKEQSVTLKEYSIPVFYKFYAVPKLDKDAFLLAEIADWEKLNLLAGQANIIFEGTYVGKSFIDPGSIQDTLNLTLGRDKRVVIKREKMVDFSSIKFLGNNKKQVFTYEITVKNNKKEKVQLLLKDQYPLSTNKEIEVELLESDGAAVNVDTGVLSWKVELAPGESRKYKMSYSMKYPKDKNIALN